jgi:hypothetical protein
MKSDSYTPAIPLDELLALARTYGPPGLVKGDDSPGSSEDARRAVNQVVCPCIRGDACVCDALADEFLRLAKQFHRQRNDNNPQGHRPWIDRWENEGGTVVDRKSTDSC